MAYVHIIGRLTADPVQKDVNGAVCTTFTVAEDTRRKDKEGNKITNFWRVTAWRALGETAAKYLHKGDRTNVVGNEVLVNTYIDTNNQWRFSLETTAADVQFLTTKAESQQNAANNAIAARTQAPAPTSAPMPVDDSEDLPF